MIDGLKIITASAVKSLLTPFDKGRKNILL
jgi:hypothetical protein